MSQYHSKWAFGEGRDHRAAVGGDDARELRERPPAVDEVDDEAEHDTLEPGVLERQLLGAPELQPDAPADGRPRDREHLLGRVDAPDLRAALRERQGELAGAAADVERPAPLEVALLDEELDELPPALVDRAKPVVGLRERPEIRRVGDASARR